MVRPAAFTPNPQTAVSNKFQLETTISPNEIPMLALEQFDHFVHQLRTEGIEVFVHQDEPDPIKPDSVFPNNWVSFHEDGVVAIYPMCAPNRRQERNLKIVDSLKEQGFTVGPKVSFTEAELHGEFLEGTGSLVLDRVNRIAYACISPRTTEELVAEWCEVFDYKAIVFHALHHTNDKEWPVYHTNVMLAIGDDLAIICSECIPDLNERKTVEESLEKTGHKLLRISTQQMNQFAANCLLVSNTSGQKFWVMSQTAYNSFSDDQRAMLSASASILSSDLSVIEQVGGGSARCMLAEVFLPRG